MIGQILRFGAVGGLATMVHMLIGTMLIQSGRAALVANCVAFAIAFAVSFLGHISFSFGRQHVDPVAALWRFGWVAMLGFGVNQGVLLALLRLTELPAMLALMVLTTVAAAISFALCRGWAFRDRSAPLIARACAKTAICENALNTGGHWH
ncbi:GtrA family protein [Paracoccus sp. R86501]|uniref:GtrA family protein n=1 Tax=Paracoccus sp. R86501 TaxID=3101711 RepID=UPI00367319DA